MQDVELSKHVLDEAVERVGDGPVVMVNLLTFRERPLYPNDFTDEKSFARAAYYEGYAGAFGQIATQLGITYELVHAGRQLLTLVPREPESWDDIVIVRYRSLSDLRRITETEDYALCHAPSFGRDRGLAVCRNALLTCRNMRAGPSANFCAIDASRFADHMASWTGTATWKATHGLERPSLFSGCCPHSEPHP